MANKRMVSKQIIDSDAFLDMSPTSQLLYFHLIMRADDEGFVGNPKKIMREIGIQNDDFKILIAKRFLISFETGVVVIKHWLIHNTIRMDRFNETTYQDEKGMLDVKQNKAYTELATTGIPPGNQMEPQVKLSKVKLSKDTAETSSAGVISIIDEFKKWNPSAKRWYGNKTQRQACEDLIESYGLEQVLKVISLLPKINKVRYLPNATTPLQLFEKYVSLKDGLEKMKNEKEEKLSKYKVAF